ncbi:MAG: hypothetical protein LBK99_14220 [Opitutaceae bacterium]|jgi:prepilin-type processing-associated H-X9-DG protein|nr:hypothetical protein [Opitutaceae bacterium]
MLLKTSSGAYDLARRYGRQTSTLPAASQTILLAEHSHSLNWCGAFAEFTVADAAAQMAGDGMTATLHPGGRLSYLFADGHVRNLAPSGTTSSRNMWQVEDQE